MQPHSLSNFKLSQATADLQVITQATDSIYTSLTDDLTTVMGPGSAEGAQTASQLLKEIEKTFGTARNTGKDDKWLQKELSAKLKSMITAERREAIDETGRNLTKHIKDTVASNKTTTQDAVKACQDKLAELDKTQGTVVLSTSSKARQLAIDKFDKSTSLIVGVAKQTATYDTTILSISEQLIKIYAEEDPTSESIGKEITRLQTLRKNVEDERQHLSKSILQHFDESIATGTKKSTIELKIPTNIQHGKGQELIDNVEAYLRNRAGEYYAILPHLHRTVHDFDHETGTYYKPPDKNDYYITIDESYRAAYAEQAETLYLRLKTLTPADIMNRICSTYKYGMHEQSETKCAEGDGPSAYFGLVSLFKPARANHRDELIDTFNNAYLHFQKGDPKRKVQHLRPKLVDAIQLGVELSWSTTGKKIVQILSRLDHVMGRKIDKYENGPAHPRDTNTYLDELFATIEAECDASARISHDTKSDTKWQTQAHNATATDLSNKDCRFGADCYRQNCTFSHPDRHGPMRSTHSQRQRQGKGGGKGGGKGSSKGGGKGGSKGDGKGRKGGKGGKGQHTCKAQGCHQRAPAPDRLCTTCFKTMLSSNGSVICKDGSEANKYLQSTSNDTKKQLYGFSAEQMEGIKMIKQALSADREEIDEDRPAPASVKRQRTMDRLGWANEAKAKEDDTRISFLKAITDGH